MRDGLQVQLVFSSDPRHDGLQIQFVFCSELQDMTAQLRSVRYMILSYSSLPARVSL